jgi:glucose 1-dehydrogenase
MPEGASLQGQTAVISGASLGIGRACAIALGKAGANVVVNYRSHDDQAEEVIQTIRQSGGQAIKFKGDVAQQQSVEQLVAKAVQEFGRLDIAVTNAVYSDRELFYEADMAGFRRTIDVTMWGAFYLLRASAQQMIRQKEAEAATEPPAQTDLNTRPDMHTRQGGAIVLVSSPHAFIPAPRSMAYNMSKAAIEHMGRTAAIELSQFRIRVNTIQPGWTDTPGERKFASEDTLRTAGAKIPLGRLGTPEEMAEAILFLCDPRQSYLTGATLLVDGGISLPWWANRGSAAPA